MQRGFTEEQLTMFGRLLQSQRAQLIGDAEKTVEEMGAETHEFADPGDRAAWESDAARDLKIRDRERKLVDKIDQALARISDGTFGECEECGELISVGRLRARTVTTLCIGCKAEQERDEGRPNHKAG